MIEARKRTPAYKFRRCARERAQYVARIRVEVSGAVADELHAILNGLANAGDYTVLPGDFGLPLQVVH